MAASAIGSLLATTSAVVGTTGGLGAFTFMGLAPGLASVLGYFAAATALGAALNALAPSQKQNTSGYSVTTRGGNRDHQIIYGETRVAGVVVVEALGGSGTNEGTRYLQRVVALAGHEIESYEGIYIDGKKVKSWRTVDSATTGITDLSSYVDTNIPLVPEDLVSIDTDGSEIADSEESIYISGSTNYFQMRFWKGTSTQVTSEGIKIEAFQGDATAWGTNHRLRGIAYIHITAGYDAEVFRNGPPEVQAVVKGKKLYDPRKDSTNAAYDASLGVSTHRSNNESTWTWSNNPALCMRDYIASGYGISEGDDGIDDGKVATAADSCEEVSTIDATVQKFTCNGGFTTAEQPFDVITNLLTSMGGMLWFAQGKWRMKAAKWSASVATFTDDNMRGSVQVQTRHSRRDNFNTVVGAFRGVQTAYEVTDYTPITDAAFVTADGGEDSVFRYDLPFTDSFEEARRLSRILLERNREQLSLNVVVDASGMQVQVGDIITLDLERFGWTGGNVKTFEVAAWDFGISNNTLETSLSLREISSGVFDEFDDGEVLELNNIKNYDTTGFYGVNLKNGDFANGDLYWTTTTGVETVADSEGFDPLGAGLASIDSSIIPRDPTSTIDSEASCPHPAMFAARVLTDTGVEFALEKIDVSGITNTRSQRDGGAGDNEIAVLSYNKFVPVEAGEKFTITLQYSNPDFGFGSTANIADWQIRVYYYDSSFTEVVGYTAAEAYRALATTSDIYALLGVGGTDRWIPRQASYEAIADAKYIKWDLVHKTGLPNIQGWHYFTGFRLNRSSLTQDIGEDEITEQSKDVTSTTTLATNNTEETVAETSVSTPAIDGGNSNYLTTPVDIKVSGNVTISNGATATIRIYTKEFGAARVGRNASLLTDPGGNFSLHEVVNLPYDPDPYAIEFRAESSSAADVTFTETHLTAEVIKR